MKFDALFFSAAKLRFVAFGLIILGLVSATGCTSLLFTLLYLVKGPDTPAEFKKLKGKSVVVVCRSQSTSDYNMDGVPREIAHKVNADLEKKVKKIKLADQRKVDQSLNKKRNQVRDFRDFGDEFDTDYVIGIELNQFRISSPNSPGSYQGRARYIVKVFDMHEAGKQVYEKMSPDIVYPPNSVIDSTTNSSDQFHQDFIDYVAYHIGKSFYSYNPRDFVAEDAKVGLR